MPLIVVLVAYVAGGSPVNNTSVVFVMAVPTVKCNRTTHTFPVWMHVANSTSVMLELFFVKVIDLGMKSLINDLIVLVAIHSSVAG